MRAVVGLFALSIVGVGCASDDPEPPAPQAPEIHTPRWAFEPWISKDISDTADTYAFVEGFRSRDIPVGVVVLDSPWETNYNTFVPNPERYNDFETLVTDLRSQDIRLVLWITQMLNEGSFDVEEGGDSYDGPAPEWEFADRKKYLVNEGQTYLWWKGVGGGLDFFNEDAVAWWHTLQDPLLDMGVAGWKLDFGDSYIRTTTVTTASGVVTHQEYSEAYYRDFWEYGASRLGTEEFVTMVRPYDKSYDFEGRFFARPEHAPISWVGDNRRDFEGLIDALDHMFRSAEAGYVVTGSDIGGYLDRSDQNLLEKIPFDAEVFLRWLAVGALTPFMQLHGRANLEPWALPEQSDTAIEAYRYWGHLHHQLVPFFYSLAEEGYAGAGPILVPVEHEVSAWDGDWRFMIGDAFLVAPVVTSTGARDVALPMGADWYDWWNPTAPPTPGGTRLMGVDASVRWQVPVFVRSGAIIPMNVDSSATGVSPTVAPDMTTVLLYPSEAPSQFVLHERDRTIMLETEGPTFRFSSANAGFLIGRAGPEPQRATLDGEAITFTFDADRGFTWLTIPKTATGGVLEVEP